MFCLWKRHRLFERKRKMSMNYNYLKINLINVNWRFLNFSKMWFCYFIILFWIFSQSFKQHVCDCIIFLSLSLNITSLIFNFSKKKYYSFNLFLFPFFFCFLFSKPNWERKLIITQETTTFGITEQTEIVLKTFKQKQQQDVIFGQTVATQKQTKIVTKIHICVFILHVGIAQKYERKEESKYWEKIEIWFLTFWLFFIFWIWVSKYFSDFHCF